MCGPANVEREKDSKKGVWVKRKTKELEKKRAALVWGAKGGDGGQLEGVTLRTPSGEPSF